MNRFRFRLWVWSHGRRHYATGLEPVRFVTTPSSARLYSRTQADAIARRFRKVKLRLKLEEAA
jgi:hypothetical protein